MSETVSDAHSPHSSAREKVLEHLFVGELLRTLWCLGVHDAEVLRSEFDGSGYDLVIECNGVLRHIQLKSTHRLGKASRQTANTAIARKPSGCVVWLFFDQTSLELGPFRWFGGKPGERIPDLGGVVARHTKGDSTGYKAERPNIRVLKKSQFAELDTMTDVVGALFGPIKNQSVQSGTLQIRTTNGPEVVA